MKTKTAESKAAHKRRVSGGEQDSSYSASKEFAKLVINKPLVYNNYGKMSSKRHTLEKDWDEERIEVLLQKNFK